MSSPGWLLPKSPVDSLDGGLCIALPAGFPQNDPRLGARQRMGGAVRPLQ